jgi:hypothetical protein
VSGFLFTVVLELVFRYWIISETFVSIDIDFRIRFYSLHVAVHQSALNISTCEPHELFRCSSEACSGEADPCVIVTANSLPL